MKGTDPLELHSNLHLPPLSFVGVGTLPPSFKAWRARERGWCQGRLPPLRGRPGTGTVPLRVGGGPAGRPRGLRLL